MKGNFLYGGGMYSTCITYGECVLFSYFLIILKQETGIFYLNDLVFEKEMILH